MNFIFKALIENEHITLVIQNSDQNYGNIFIGNFESLDISAVKERKINGFLSFSKTLNTKFPFEDFQFNLMIPLEKEESSIMSNYLEICLKFLEKNQRKTNLLVFCSDGKTLSPIILIAFLMKNFNYDFVKAYDAFALNRPILDKKTIGSILSQLFPNALNSQPMNSLKTESNVLKDLTNMINRTENINLNKKENIDEQIFSTPKTKNNKMVFTKAHSIESYRKNLEPELKFEDINCIIQPNENNVAGIYLGNFNAAKDLQLLQNLNISAVLTVAEELELPYKSKDVKVAHLKIMASDIENFDLSKHFQKCFEFINKYQGTTNILIHCYAGVSRSVTITIAYLMKFYGMSFKKALSLVRERRRQIYPNSGFINQLRSFEKMLLWENKKVQGILY